MGQQGEPHDSAGLREDAMMRSGIDLSILDSSPLCPLILRPLDDLALTGSARVPR